MPLHIDQAGQLAKAKTPLFDRRLGINLALSIVSSVVLLVCIKQTTTIHLPYLLGAALAISLGYLEPRKGWVLAIAQVFLIWTGYTLFTAPPDSPTDGELETFALYGTLILTFVGSFIGGMLKRVLDQG